MISLTKSSTIEDLYETIVELNDSNQTPPQLFSSLQRNLFGIEDQFKITLQINDSKDISDELFSSLRRNARQVDICVESHST